jgi:hypothetical protein
MLVAQPPGDLEPIDARKAGIDEEDVWLTGNGVGELQRFLAVDRLAHDHDVVGRLEELDEALARQRMVLRDAHPDHLARLDLPHHLVPFPP